MYPLVSRGNAGRYTQARAWLEGSQQRVKHLGVAVRGLDEELGLAFLCRAMLQGLQATGAVGRVDGQVAIEGKALPVQPAGHHRQKQAAGPHQRNNLETATLGQSHHIRPRVGHGRTACLADHAHSMPFGQGAQIGLETGSIGMLAHLVELAVVNGERAIDLAQEAACRAHLLHDEVAQALDNLQIIGGDHLLQRRVAQGARNQIESSFHVFRP